MWIQSSVFICCLALFPTISIMTTGAQKVNFSYTSQGAPDFYLNDPIKMTCSASGFSNMKQLVIYYHGAGCLLTLSGCWKVGRNWRARNETIQCAEFSTVADQYCLAVGHKEGFTVEMGVNATENAIAGTVDCRGFETTGDQIISDVVVDFNTWRVAPRNVQMRLSPEKPVEEEEFSFSCSSEEAVPKSLYNYAVNGRIVTDNKYTTVVADREGVTLSCIDMEHANWKGGNTNKTVHVLPRYITATNQTIFSKKLDFESEGERLSCSDHVEAYPAISTFDWKIDGVVQSILSTDYIFLTPKTEGSLMLVSCRASNGLAKTVTITWLILWEASVKSSTSLASSPTCPNSPTCSSYPNCQNCPITGAIFGGVVGSIVLITVLLVTSMWCWWRVRVVRRSKKRVRIETCEESYTQLSVVRRDKGRCTSVPPLPLQPLSAGPEATDHITTDEYLTPKPHYTTANYVDMDAQDVQQADNTYESMPFVGSL